MQRAVDCLMLFVDKQIQINDTLVMDTTTTNKIAALVGSDKQITWASDLRAKWIAALGAEVASQTARLSYGDTAANVTAYCNEVIVTAQKILDKLVTLTSAKQIIDMRDASPVAVLERVKASLVAKHDKAAA